jgi:hypothetical protein
MIDSGSILSEQEFEADPGNAVARLKAGIYTDIIPLYAALHDIPQFREWLPDIMRVILEDHYPEDNCQEDYDYDSTHCAAGYCPAKVVCLDVKRNLRRPDCESLEYQHFPLQTALAWVARLDYLIEDDYLTDSEGNLLYDQYSRKLKKGLKGFNLNESDNWF